MQSIATLVISIFALHDLRHKLSINLSALICQFTLFENYLKCPIWIKNISKKVFCWFLVRKACAHKSVRSKSVCAQKRTLLKMRALTKACAHFAHHIAKQDFLNNFQTLCLVTRCSFISFLNKNIMRQNTDLEKNFLMFFLSFCFFPASAKLAGVWFGAKQHFDAAEF